MKIEIIGHYAKDDPDCVGDYTDVELFIDGQIIRSWGDDYHGKGAIRAQAFVDGIRWAVGGAGMASSVDGSSVQVRKIYVADREY